jgi:hypothetical protein
MRGVPTRNGVRKHRIIDAPVNNFNFVPPQGAPVNRTDGVAQGQRHEVISFGKPLCGERGDSFIAGLRFIIVRNRYRSSRPTGYREMYGALWEVQRSNNCPHGMIETADAEFLANSGASAIHGDDNPFLRDDHVLFYRTSRSTAARWWAVVTIAVHSQSYRSGHPRQLVVLLRQRSCCMQCVATQAALSDSRHIVVL